MTDTQGKQPVAQAVAVTQADRDAAADYLQPHDYFRSEEVRAGKRENHAAVLAFAHHRLASLAEAGGSGAQIEAIRALIQPEASDEPRSIQHPPYSHPGDVA